MLSLICARRNGWVSIRHAGDLRRRRTHYDVILLPEKLIGEILPVYEFFNLQSRFGTRGLWNTETGTGFDREEPHFRYPSYQLEVLLATTTMTEEGQTSIFEGGWYPKIGQQ